MKFNLYSISTKLIIGGVLAVLLPLLVVGWISYHKSHDALLDLSMERAQEIAVDLAKLTHEILEGELHQVGIIAAEKNVTDLTRAVDESGLEHNREQIRKVYEDLTHQFESMAHHYQGIFIADEHGELITGALEGGKEYKGINIGDREYFKRVMNSDKPIVSEINRSKSTGKLIVVASAPIKTEGGKFAGMVGSVIKADYFTDLVSGHKIGKTGYGYMADKDGLLVAHPKPELVLKLNLSNIKEMESIVTKMKAGETGVEEYHFKGDDKIAGFAPVGINGWMVAATQNESEFLASSNAIRISNLVVTLVAALITGFVVFFAARSIVKPINAAMVGLKDIAQGEGDLTMRLPVSSKDEVGELSKWFNLFIEKLQGIIKDITGGVDTLSSSSTELSAISEQMSQGIQNVSEKSNTVSAAAEEMSANMNTVAAAMEESSTNTSMVATAAEEMSSTIDEIAKNAEEARNISDEASQKASNASSNMDQLGNAANSIGKVVETITEISEQVNLLALNATIEAARAGEAGKGFAVVANEIKELAKQTAEASQDIKSKIESIQSTTSTTVGQISEITKVITDVNSVVATIATAVEQQSAATREIAGNVAQASQGIQEVNENVNQSSSVSSEISQDIAGVSMAMNEMDTGSNQVNLSAQDLSSLSENLRRMVDQFKI